MGIQHLEGISSKRQNASDLSNFTPEQPVQISFKNLFKRGNFETHKERIKHFDSGFIEKTGKYVY
jgi:hypothetical protein